MSETTRDQVFISYAHEDLDTVRRICAGLKERQLKIWFDKEHLRPGEWMPQIEKAIPRSRYFIICISNSALRKTGDDEPGFIDKELNAAYKIADRQPDTEFAIVPVRIEDCDHGDNRLRGFYQYDLFIDIEDGLDDLAVHLGGISLSDASVKDERSDDEKLVDNLIGRAMAAYYAGDFKKTLTFAESALICQPDNYKIWMDKGAALGSMGRHEEAATAYRKASELEPNDYRIWFSMGVSLASVGKHKEAIDAFDKALEIDPSFADGWADKGLSLMGLRKDEEAAKAIKKAAKLSPDSARILACRGILEYSAGRYHNAIDLFNMALKREGPFHDPRTIFNRGQAYLKLGQHNKAYDSFDIACKIAPKFPECLFNMGSTLNKLGRPQDALDAYNKVVDLKADHPGVWGNKALMHIKLEQWDDALSAYEEAVKQNSDDKEVLHNKAFVHHRLGQTEAALACCDEVLQMDPNFQPTLLLRRKITCL